MEYLIVFPSTNRPLKTVFWTEYDEFRTTIEHNTSWQFLFPSFLSQFPYSKRNSQSKKRLWTFEKTFICKNEQKNCKKRCSLYSGWNPRTLDWQFCEVACLILADRTKTRPNQISNFRQKLREIKNFNRIENKAQFALTCIVTMMFYSKKIRENCKSKVDKCLKKIDLFHHKCFVSSSCTKLVVIWDLFLRQFYLAFSK